MGRTKEAKLHEKTRLSKYPDQRAAKPVSAVHRVNICSSIGNTRSLTNGVGVQATGEGFFVNLFMANPAPMAIVSILTGELVDANDSCLQFYGWDKQAAMGKPVGELEFWSQEDGVHLVNELKLHGEVRNMEFAVQTRYNGKRYVTVNANAIELYNDRYILVTFSDITTLKQAEMRFMKAFNSNPSGMVVLNTDGQYVAVNDSMLEGFGYKRTEVIGKSSQELGLWVDEMERQKVFAQIATQGSVRNYEALLRRKNGEMRAVLLGCEMIEMGNDQYFLFSAHDITDRQQLAREIAQLDRMNLIGQMAAGIGHEIRNPMTTVRGYLQLLRNKSMFQPYVEQIKVMIEELDRANSIITEFLSLAKNNVTDLIPANLNDIIQAMYPLMEADATEVGKGVMLRLGDIPKLLLNEKEMRQVLLNLVRNGLEASPPQTGVIIRTYEELDEVILAVTDCGQEIPKEVLQKMGTPFFTTKDSGTGLGLVVCYSVAARHHATLAIETSQKGTTVFMRFKHPVIQR